MSERKWFQTALQLKGSVVPAVMGRTLLCGGLGVLICLLGERGIKLGIPALASLIPNIVLGLLLVFRTNTAYDRFWEGRKCWGTIVNSSRNLGRQLWIAVETPTREERSQKEDAIRLLIAFCFATKVHLRQENRLDELDPWLRSVQLEKLQSTNNRPLEIAFWIGDYLQERYRANCLNIHQLNTMQVQLNWIVDSLGGCERILRTPMPLAYAIHLKQLLLLYCLSLPFQMVDSVKWWTGPVVALISFILFGVEAIGIEIENPFGRDPNDLPLDTICNTLASNLEDLMTLTPGGDRVG